MADYSASGGVLLSGTAYTIREYTVSNGGLIIGTRAKVVRGYIGSGHTRIGGDANTLSVRKFSSIGGTKLSGTADSYFRHIDNYIASGTIYLHISSLVTSIGPITKYIASGTLYLGGTLEFSRTKTYVKLCGDNTPGTDSLFDKVELLIHADGDNGSFIFTDSSSRDRGLVSYDNAQISTAQSKFGGSSGIFPQYYSWLEIELPVTNGLSGYDVDNPNSWCIEIFYYGVSRADGNYLFNSGNGGLFFGIKNNLIFVGYKDYDDIEQVYTEAFGTTFVPLGEWINFTWSYDSSSRTLRGFFGGNIEIEVNNIKIVDYNGGWNVWGWADGNDNTFYWDDLRVTVGDPRYTDSFIVSTSSFPDIGSTPCLHDITFSGAAYTQKNPYIVSGGVKLGGAAAKNKRRQYFNVSGGYKVAGSPYIWATNEPIRDVVGSGRIRVGGVATKYRIKKYKYLYSSGTVKVGRIVGGSTWPYVKFASNSNRIYRVIPKVNNSISNPITINLRTLTFYTKIYLVSGTYTQKDTILAIEKKFDIPASRAYEGFNEFIIAIDSSGSISVSSDNAVFSKYTSIALPTNQWVDLCIHLDTTNSVEENRLKVYYNNTEQTFNAYGNGYPSINSSVITDTTLQNCYFVVGGTVHSYYGYGTRELYNCWLANTVYVDGLVISPYLFTDYYSGPYGAYGWHLRYANNDDLGQDYNEAV
jgi:hypothetical protein